MAGFRLASDFSQAFICEHADFASWLTLVN